MLVIDKSKIVNLFAAGKSKKSSIKSYSLVFPIKTFTPFGNGLPEARR